jgi:hypothetical protein
LDTTSYELSSTYGTFTISNKNMNSSVSRDTAKEPWSNETN